MRLSWLSLSALWVTSLTLATTVLPWFQQWKGNRSQSRDLLTVALGDSRKLFANHFYSKADAYFHSGYYPGIFDNAKGSDKMHMAANAGAGHEKEENEDFLGPPKDWIDAFSRHFFPSTHHHLGEEEHDPHDADHHPGSEHRVKKGEERELLPWLKLSATLDPQRPDTYIVASFWLRSRLGKVDEAEQFLRQGLQANPGQVELLYELGRIYEENRKNPDRARNLWELALKNWREGEGDEKGMSIFVKAQVLGHLAKLEEEQKNFKQAAAFLGQLEAISPNKDSIHKWRLEMEAKQ